MHSDMIALAYLTKYGRKVERKWIRNQGIKVKTIEYSEDSIRKCLSNLE